MSGALQNTFAEISYILLVSFEVAFVSLSFLLFISLPIFFLFIYFICTHRGSFQNPQELARTTSRIQSIKRKHPSFHIWASTPWICGSFKQSPSSTYTSKLIFETSVIAFYQHIINLNGTFFFCPLAKLHQTEEGRPLNKPQELESAASRIQWIGRKHPSFLISDSTPWIFGSFRQSPSRTYTGKLICFMSSLLLQTLKLSENDLNGMFDFFWVQNCSIC
jgi:hypothetical protein